MKFRPLIFLAIACAALPACAPPGTDWTNAEAPRALHVDFQRLTHTAAFVPGMTQLAGGERESLANFLEISQSNPDDPIFLEAAADDKLSNSRISALARDLTRQGYAVATLPPARDAVARDALLVVVERYVVTQPECPNWTKSSSEDHDNAPTSNFGCANLTNLGLMVADPRDLVHGRALGPIDATAAGLAIQRYRDGQPKQLPALNAGTTYSATQQQQGGAPAGGGTGTGTGQ